MPEFSPHPISKRPNLSIIAILILMGIILVISPAFLPCLLVTILIFHAALKVTDAKDRNFVAITMCAALIMRLAALMIVQYYCYSKGQIDIFGDAEDNIVQGLNISKVLKNVSELTLNLGTFIGGRYNTHGKSLFNTFFFILFGDDVVSLKYINILAIVLTGWLVYDITKRIYSSIAGKFAMFAVLFWPTIFVWSITDLKESHLILSLISIPWLANKTVKSASKKNRLLYVIITIFVIAYSVSLKLKLMLPVVFVSVIVIAAYYIFSWCRIKKYRMSLISIILITLTAVLLFTVYRSHILGVFCNWYETIISYNIGFQTSGGWNYDLFKGSQDYYSVSFIIRYFIEAWLHFMLEPFPWHIFSLSMLATYPIMIIWYLMLFLSIIGLIRLKRLGKIKEVFPLLIFTIIYISVVGMSVSNIGTAVRFRDAIMPVIAILASCGLANTQERIPKT